MTGPEHYREAGALGDPEQAPTVPAARKHAALRAALTGELRRAEGWPLSTAQLRALVGRAPAGGGVYPALRAMERAGACVRVRDRSPLASRSVYWCVPSSPFAAAAEGRAR